MKNNITDCLICKKKLKERQRKFCSRKCYSVWLAKTMKGKNSHLWKGGLIEVKCKECGKKKKVALNETKQKYGNFCFKCFNVWRSKNLRGENSPCFGIKHSNQFRKECKKRAIFQWQNPEFIQKQMKSRVITPNKEEQRLNNLLQEILPNEYKYVGDWSFTIEGKNPDFINVNGQKKIIEYNGYYWHKGENSKKRIGLFKKYGYDTLVIWSSELRNLNKLKSKVLEFNIINNTKGE